MEKHITIKSTRVDDPNIEVIKDFFRTEFPPIAAGNTESMVTLIAGKIIGSRSYRLAGAPTLESQVEIRGVIRDAIESGKRIPMLVVCGPKKTDNSESIDIAELSALRVLACVQRQVQEYYPTGLDIILRIEDSTGYFLEGESPEITNSIEVYTEELRALIRILGYDNFITAVRETSIIEYGIFKAEGERLYPYFYNYLMESEVEHLDKWEKLDSYKVLQKVGWVGIIPPEMREYYHRRYSLIYPEMSAMERLDLMAKYFGITLARGVLDGIGSRPEWNHRFIQINFAPPVTGEPKNRTTTRIYYRTVPLSHTKKHLPFWRAKGYLKLNGNARISLATWNEKLDLIPFEVQLSRGEDTVTIKADYMIVE